MRNSPSSTPKLPLHRKTFIKLDNLGTTGESTATGLISGRDNATLRSVLAVIETAFPYAFEHSSDVQFIDEAWLEQKGKYLLAKADNKTRYTQGRLQVCASFNNSTASVRLHILVGGTLG